ncbi:nucleoside-diphosphate kinase [Mangrovihabitans endophyticus]|uniref:Nucleoside-diphosphate kinase n=1 Tax=Mangrovihabitans endophyticus TaxID=1751298 RepID=A0A8J3FQ44_9ACTN|nr:nucleoside-diphosphate kinase [Mangrovihabitans endophyticus]GGL06882.1 nucleoside-diphosphate kinase [Mangrovihabitans endophyticus]
MTTAIDVDWTRWTVVLLKPDCIARDLVDPVLTWVGTEVTLVDQRLVTPTEQQIFAHYDDLLTTRRAHFTWVDVPADLRRTYVGRRVGIALGYAPNAAPRLRDLLGHYDPTHAGLLTIRGRFGQDSLRQAQAEHRLIANVIHSSDDPVGAEREFGIWYGPAHRHLLHPPTQGGQP